MRPTPRHAAAAFILTLIALAGSPLRGVPLDSPSTTCSNWLDVRSDGVTRLACGVTALAEPLARCPPEQPIHRGDRVSLQDGCVVGVRPMPARRRLALGIGLDVNRASTAELMAVSGIGPAMARRIVAGRPYERLADLERVRGIGRARRLRFTSSLRLGPPRRLWPSSPSPDASTPRRP